MPFSLYADFVDSVSEEWVIPKPEPVFWKTKKCGVYCLYPYAQAKPMIKQWKFNGDVALGYRLGQVIGETFKDVLHDKTISYVPRYGEGYPYVGNHLFSLLGGIADVSGCEVVPAYKKIRQTFPQKALSRRARMMNLSGSFAAVGKADIVVDDVFTTGSTCSSIYDAAPFEAWLVVSRVDLILEH